MLFFQLICLVTFAGLPAPYQPGTAGFTVTVGKIDNPYHTMTFSVMPGEALAVRLNTDQPDTFEVIEQGTGRVFSPKGKTVTWPGSAAPGLSTLHIRHMPSGEIMTLHRLVKTPLRPDAQGYMEGYRLGRYPDIPLRNLDVYNKPVGLVRVTDDMLQLQLSPHFTLGQFVCKQTGGYPKFILVRTLLLLKLEHLLAHTNAMGIETDTFQVLSGYRTPYYNTAIGNVKYSRHQWGGAADIYIDRDRDGMMDDLNGDGRIDVGDAKLLYDLFDADSYKHGNHLFIGGLGQYRKTASHGPFVHVDVRGFRARWGD